MSRDFSRYMTENVLMANFQAYGGQYFGALGAVGGGLLDSYAGTQNAVQWQPGMTRQQAQAAQLAVQSRMLIDQQRNSTIQGFFSHMGQNRLNMNQTEANLFATGMTQTGMGNFLPQIGSVQGMATVASLGASRSNSWQPSQYQQRASQIAFESHYGFSGQNINGDFRRRRMNMGRTAGMGYDQLATFETMSRELYGQNRDRFDLGSIKTIRDAVNSRMAQQVGNNLNLSDENRERFNEVYNRSMRRGFTNADALDQAASASGASKIDVQREYRNISKNRTTEFVKDFQKEFNVDLSGVSDDVWEAGPEAIAEAAALKVSKAPELAETAALLKGGGFMGDFSQFVQSVENSFGGDGIRPDRLRQLAQMLRAASDDTGRSIDELNNFITVLQKLPGAEFTDAMQTTKSVLAAASYYDTQQMTKAERDTRILDTVAGQQDVRTSKGGILMDFLSSQAQLGDAESQGFIKSLEGMTDEQRESAIKELLTNGTINGKAAGDTTQSVVGMLAMDNFEGASLVMAGNRRRARDATETSFKTMTTERNDLLEQAKAARTAGDTEEADALTAKADVLQSQMGELVSWRDRADDALFAASRSEIRNQVAKTGVNVNDLSDSEMSVLSQIAQNPAAFNNLSDQAREGILSKVEGDTPEARKARLLELQTLYGEMYTPDGRTAQNTLKNFMTQDQRGSINDARTQLMENAAKQETLLAPRAVVGQAIDALMSGEKGLGDLGMTEMLGVMGATTQMGSREDRELLQALQKGLAGDESNAKQFSDVMSRVGQLSRQGILMKDGVAVENPTQDALDSALMDARNQMGELLEGMNLGGAENVNKLMTVAEELTPALEQGEEQKLKDRDESDKDKDGRDDSSGKTVFPESMEINGSLELNIPDFTRTVAKMVAELIDPKSANGDNPRGD